MMIGFAFPILRGSIVYPERIGLIRHVDIMPNLDVIGTGRQTDFVGFQILITSTHPNKVGKNLGLAVGIIQPYLPIFSVSGKNRVVKLDGNDSFIGDGYLIPIIIFELRNHTGYRFIDLDWCCRGEIIVIFLFAGCGRRDCEGNGEYYGKKNR